MDETDVHCILNPNGYDLCCENSVISTKPYTFKPWSHNLWLL